MKLINGVFKCYTEKICIAATSVMTILLVSACTKNFDSFNRNPIGPTTAELNVATLFKPIEQGIFQSYQVTQNLNADYFCGYSMSPQGFGRSLTNANYSFVDSWTTPTFGGPYTTMLGPIKNTIEKTSVKKTQPELWAVALILEVECAHRLTDKFGPCPYDSVGTSLSSIPFQSQKDIYMRMFAQLDTAAENLNTFLKTNSSISTALTNRDAVYQGDLSKWLKLANSLRLRLAMNIVKVDPATAQSQAELAMSAPGGLIKALADNATVAMPLNDYNQITLSFGDCRMGASIDSYMNGYKDPRLYSYFMVVNGDPTQSSSVGPIPPAFANKFVGIALGSPFRAKPFYSGYSCYNYLENFTPAAPEEFFCAPEVWFLQAEAALRGWKGAGDATQDYTTGITLSMQRNAKVSASHPITQDHISAYLADHTSKPADYLDPNVPANNMKALGTITIAWDPSASNEEKLERIITQKWLAMFPEGQQAWTDFRRTGYPRLFPTQDNESGGTIDTKIQVRRMPYPTEEQISNEAAYKAGVALLGGPDNGGVRLWWDKDLGGKNF